MSRLFRDIALAPLYLAQLLGVLARAERLPEAAGPRQGHVAGQGRMRLLVLGDSSGAGVGVARQDQALIGQILVHLPPAQGVEWRLVARSGATSGAALKMLGRIEAQFDVAVLALGVNDVLRHSSAHSFARAQAALITRLQHRHRARLVLASAVPPLGAFPAFPQPLRAHLGRRAARLDRCLQELCAQHGAVHVPFDLDPAPDLLARDGFHPGARLYQHWGARMAGLALRGVS
ncbi:MAG: SGNH/GDSL hydrolase family protein [Rhodobacteraceae bacterium]|nr:SGNH/GDSL hydrolase family protein [Paracoccaceae bacterium]